MPADGAGDDGLLAARRERALQALVVELPDGVPTKDFSQRSLVKALWALRAVWAVGVRGCVVWLLCVGGVWYIGVQLDLQGR